jgi:foldase protein PrsA
MKKLVALVAVAAFLSACADEVRPAAATVAGQRITTARVQAGLDLFVKSAQYDQLVQQQKPGEIQRQYEQSFLSRLIRRAVMEREARQASIEISDADVEERFEQIKSDVGSEEDFQKELRNQGISEAEVRAFARDSLLEAELRAVATEGSAPTEEDLQAFYDENAEQFTEVHTAHILVDNVNKARDINDELRAAPEGEREQLFEQLARRFSTDTGSAQRGGDLGFVPAAQFVEEFARTAVNLDQGEISGPVQTQFGFHIIRLIDKRLTSFEDARADIEQQLSGEGAEQAWTEWLRDAYREAEVDVNPRYGVLDLEQLLVVNATADDVPGGAEASPTPQG